LEDLRVPPTQIVHQRRRQQLAVFVAPQEGLDLGAHTAANGSGRVLQVRLVIVADGIGPS